MKTKNTYLVGLGLGFILGLLSIHCGDAAKLSVIIGSLIIAILSLMNPGFGILALFPLLVVIQPTPLHPGWRELSFAAVLVAVTAGSVWQGRDILWVDGKRLRYYGLMVFLLIVCNLFAAQYHLVDFNDWIRGVLPFSFLGFFVPVYLECRRDSRLIPWVVASLVSAAFLFCWLVVSYYIVEKLWLPYHYVMDHGKWLRIDDESAALLSQPVFHFRARVTQVLQQATDILLPTAFVLSAWLIFWGRRAVSLAVGVVILITSTMAIILTFTRSMLLAAVFATSILAIGRLGSKGGFKRMLVVAVLSIVSALSTIQTFDHADIYFKRYRLLKQAAEYCYHYFPKVSHFIVPIGGERRQELLLPEIEDENVTSRLEEYRIAFGMFLESPLIGQGFGVRHEMSFASGLGDPIIVKVGYVHNWVFYFLMVGGLLGFLGWSVVLFGPALIVLWQKVWVPEMRWLVCATVCLLATYTLFFAVFRLISFNIFLAGLWGLVLSSLPRSSTSPGEECP